MHDRKHGSFHRLSESQHYFHNTPPYQTKLSRKIKTGEPTGAIHNTSGKTSKMLIHRGTPFEVELIVRDVIFHPS